MALNFPDSPTLNQVYTDTVSGFSYQWDGVVWQSYTPSASKNINTVDAIEGSFNGSTQTFALAVAGTALYPANAQQLIVVLGGIVQEPGVDYTISGSNITFSDPPAAGLSLSIVSLGPAVPVNAVLDGTITPVKLSTGGPTWNTSGGLNVTGIATVNSLSIGSTQVISSARQLQNITSLDATTTATIESAVSAAPNDFSSLYVSGISTLGYSSGVGTVRIGSGSTTLTVEGNARVTGVVTASSAIVGSAVTINSSGVNVSGIVTATEFDISGSANSLTSGGLNVGVATATSFVGPLTGNVSGTATTATNLADAANITTGTINSARLSGSYSINITGTASTASFATTAFNLQGTPSLSVGIVTVTGFSGVAYAGITSTAVSKTLINREYCAVVAAGVTITLPASPSPGWEVGIAVGNFTDVVVGRNGSNIMALAENFTMDKAYLALQFVYIDSTQGWRFF